MSRYYLGYRIYKEFNHYVVVDPDGKEWTEDTVTDAYKAIDEEVAEKVDQKATAVI